MPAGSSDDTPMPMQLRAARQGDLAELVRMKGEGSEGTHLRRLNDAAYGRLEYLVGLRNGTVSAYAVLLIDWPETWPAKNRTDALPMLVDVQVDPGGKDTPDGLRHAFVGALENHVRELGHGALHVEAEPENNPQRFRFWAGRGYQPLQDEPWLSEWSYRDGCGKVIHGRQWVVEMRKNLKVREG